MRFSQNCPFMYSHVARREPRGKSILMRSFSRFCRSAFLTLETSTLEEYSAHREFADFLLSFNTSICFRYKIGET